MSKENDIRTNKEHLLIGFPVFHLRESAELTYKLLIDDFGEPFKRCSMYSSLKNKNDMGSLYTIVEFNQGVKFENITDNPYLLNELLYLGIRYLAFFDGSREFIVNAIGCNDYNMLDELLHHKRYKITDVPVQYPVKIYSIKDLEYLLYIKLTNVI